jgi:hypothetical protein
VASARCALTSASKRAASSSAACACASSETRRRAAIKARLGTVPSSCALGYQIHATQSSPSNRS